MCFLYDFFLSYGFCNQLFFLGYKCYKNCFLIVKCSSLRFVCIQNFIEIRDMPQKSTRGAELRTLRLNSAYPVSPVNQKSLKSEQMEILAGKCRPFWKWLLKNKFHHCHSTRHTLFPLQTKNCWNPSTFKSKSIKKWPKNDKKGQ